MDCVLASRSNDLNTSRVKTEECFRGSQSGTTFPGIKVYEVSDLLYMYVGFALPILFEIVLMIAENKLTPKILKKYTVVSLHQLMG